MIRLPKNFFTNLTLAQYREQLKLLPRLNDENTRVYTMLGFTLLAMSFFGIFAINPTLSTIAELRRQFDDLQVIYKKLITKGQDLSTLQEKYQLLSPQLSVIFDAIPQKPEVPKFIAQVNALLKSSNLKTKSLRTYGIEITPDKKAVDKNSSSFVFALEAEGSYDDILAFSQNITHMNRLVTLEMISISKGEKTETLTLNLRGRQVFLALTMFKRDTLIILWMTFLTVAAWIGFNIYHIIVTSTINQELQTQISPINPNFDQDTINKLKTREDIEPLYQITDSSSGETATESAITLITPTLITPTIGPTESTSVISGGP